MTVKKKVNTSIQNFIDKGANVKAEKAKAFRNILVRIPEEILSQLDELIEKKPWLNRTQWIIGAIHEKLTKENN